MRIVNNKIQIAQGETPTYEAAVIDKETGCPLMLLEEYYSNGVSKGLHNPIIEFVVRSSVYDDVDNYVFKIYMSYKDEPRFKTTVIESYNDLEGSTDPVWDNSVIPPIENQAIDTEGRITNAVMYRLTKDDVTEYRFYNPNVVWNSDEEHPDNITENNYKWVPYEFVITFPFPYSDGFVEEGKMGYGGTSDMESKTYKYEVTLFDGTLVETDDMFYLTDINFKKPLLEVTDFIVGGSVSE